MCDFEIRFVCRGKNESEHLQAESSREGYKKAAAILRVHSLTNGDLFGRRTPDSTEWDHIYSVDVETAATMEWIDLAAPHPSTDGEAFVEFMN